MEELNQQNPAHKNYIIWIVVAVLVILVIALIFLSRKNNDMNVDVSTVVETTPPITDEEKVEIEKRVSATFPAQSISENEKKEIEKRVSARNIALPLTDEEKKTIQERVSQ